MTTDPGPSSGQRLERALELFFEHAQSGGRDGARLLAHHHDLRDLLEPMLAGSSQAADPEPGAGVLGDFRLVRELGRGGMGIVYEAWQRSLDRPVALKVLSPALMASPSAVARFRREAAAVGKLRHPGIVEVHGFGQDGDRHWFAMELVDGAPLQQCCDRFRQPAAAVQLLVEVLDALQHSHAAGLVHRDVKPGNVLIRRDGAAVLTDFGLASDAELPSMTTEGSFLGTLEYASPEQVQGGVVDARSDVWSAGVILYELLAGSRPFQAESAVATMQAILVREPPSLCRSNPAVSRDLAAIVDRALQKDPGRRYASAGRFLADLRAWQSGGVVSARAPGVVERCMRWVRREPWRAAAAAVVLLALPIVTGSLGYLWANAPRIAAATAAEAVARREEVLGFAWWQLYERDAAAGLSALDTLPADAEDLEVAVARAMLLKALDRREEALVVLQAFSGELPALVRDNVEGRAAAIDRIEGKGVDAVDCSVRANLLYEWARRRDAMDKVLLRRAMDLATQAVVLSSAPRINHLMLWGILAKHMGDVSLIAAAERALAFHFPDSALAIESRISIQAELAPSSTLALVANLRPEATEPAWVQNNIGVANEKLGRLGEAEAAYRRAIERDAGYGLAWANLGTVLRLQKRPKEAAEALRKAVTLAPRSARTWNSLGVTLRVLGEQAEARRAFEQAIALRSDYAVPLYNLGNLALADGDAVAAIDLFRRAAAADPKYVQAVANLGNALKKAGRKQEALVEYVRATTIAPNDLIPQHNVARTALELGLAELALQASTRACEIGKDNPDALWLHAEALLAQAKVDGAAALATAQRADARDGDAVALDRRIVLARAFEASGDRTGAIGVLEVAERDPRAAKDPQLDEARELLARLRAAK